MSSINIISVEKLARLVGTPHCPDLVDVRTDEDYKLSPHLLPGSVRRPYGDVAEWATEFAGRHAIVICQKGQKLSQGVAALLRVAGASADTLEGGFAAWETAKLPLVPVSKLPPRNAKGATLWVTRERPKIDRIACPWLIRRFIDPEARFLYAPPDRVVAVAKEGGAVAYDIPGAEPFSHDGELCSFDGFLKVYGLSDPALDKLALIVRGADTGRPDLTPQSGGLLALSLGMSANFPEDDHGMLEVGMHVYDALYAWCRSLQGETHNWKPAL